MFPLTVFEILLFEDKSVKNLKNIPILLKLLESDWLTSLGGFEWFLNFFHFSLTLSVPEKLENSIFETPKIPQTLNIYNLKTASAKSINLHCILLESLSNIILKTFA